MVVNMGLFSPGKALSPGTLWVVEQIPGLVVDGDMTQQLGKLFVKRSSCSKKTLT